MISTMVVLTILLGIKPLADPRSNKIEVFNEITVLSLTYMLVFFTDIVGEAQFRSDLGILYLCIAFSNIAVHIFLLTFESCRSLKRCIQRKCFKKRVVKKE